jgi:hypothetical protein
MCSSPVFPCQGCSEQMTKHVAAIALQYMEVTPSAADLHDSTPSMQICDQQKCVLS